MLVAVSGPVFTLGLEWLGMILLQSNPSRVFGYMLVFASFAPLRFIQTLTGRGDELWIAQQWVPPIPRVAVAGVVFVAALPPVVAAYRATHGRRRVRTLLSWYLLPLPALAVLLMTSRALYGLNGDEARGFLILGTPVLVLPVQAAATVTYLMMPRIQLEVGSRNGGCNWPI
jgi:hypothetical protein